jgi:hypothetical protein
MADFMHEDLRGTRFERVDLSGAQLRAVDRARRLRPELLHESVGGEWSFIETLRHLVFATDSWISGRSLATPRHGTLWTCLGTRCLTLRGCPATARYDPC